MQLKQDAHVFTANDQAVGRVDRVVIDPKTKEVTHIVVRKGLFFTEDKVVPISLVAAATDERVALRENAGDLNALPNFEESHFIVVDEHERTHYAGDQIYAPPLYWYGAPGMYGPPPFLEETKKNIPEGTVALKEGAEVISVDSKHVGHVEQVLTDPQTQRATHFVISKGLLLKERKLVPMAWVNQMTEEEVHVAVGSRLLDELRPYAAKHNSKAVEVVV